MPKATYKRRSDGRYRVKYKGKDFYGSTQSEAVAKREAYKKQLAQGLREETLGMCFDEYAVRWLSTTKKSCSDKTYNDYASIINQFIDFFGHARMQHITQLDITDFYNTLEGRSSSSIKKNRMLLKGIFSTAYNDRIILSNPCHDAKPPKGYCGTHRPITDEERELIHQSVGHHDMALAAMVMLYAGLRRGEVVAIDDSCIDWEHECIMVTEGVAYPRNQPQRKKPKSDAGIRAVPIFGQLKNVLEQVDGLVVSNRNCELMSKSSWTKKWNSYKTYLETVKNKCCKRWYGRTKEHKAILAAGGKLPEWWECTIRSHDLRHSYVTMLYDIGVDIKTAVKWVGHADAEMIMKIYAHLTEERENRSKMSAEKYVEKCFSGSTQGSTEDHAPKIDAAKRI